ncbi:MAG TPA: hypothetical protein PKX52_02160 [Methanomassiliicoccaceae archaeon]|jgi:muconolactone delta-isomerase|nr:hypothetical protein [Methanomassiliicoccaceae archaeon]HQA20833.1 hypothetical protein [Methanomassiliicoccaceae archaeon]HQD88154.1 hypothetical protein [Methanomassiliicoccaceae archaeon]
MEFLVLMKLTEDGMGETADENKNILEKLIIPSIEDLLKMEKEGIVRGGFFEGQRAAAFIFSVSSGEELDDMLSSLPCSAVFGIESMPLESLADALTRDRRILEDLKKA